MKNKDKMLKFYSKKFGFRDRGFWGLVLIFVLLTLFFTIINPTDFLSLGNFQSMSYQFPEFGLMSLGVMLAMISGGIDLSVVGTANLTAIVTASIMLKLSGDKSSSGQVTVAILVSLLAGMLVGILCGYFNGFLVSRLKVPPMLATLGTLQLYTGIGLVITKGSGISRLPYQYSETGRMLVFDLIPLAVFIFVLAALVLGFRLNKTRFGKELYMVGSNPVAARFSGVNNNSVLTRAYISSGVLSAIAGCVMLANYNSAKPDYGSAYTLQTILVVVLGGVSPDGGFGKVGGVVLSILILQISSSGLNLFPSISNFYRQLIWGAVLLIVLSVSFITGNLQQKRIAKLGREQFLASSKEK